MHLIERDLSDPQDNVALDAELFHRMEREGGTETLRFWETRKRAVIVGALGVVELDVHAHACQADGVPVVRRISGGGAVLVGDGCLNYSLVLSLDARPELRHVPDSYRLILGRLVEALAIPRLALRGMSDITFGERKVSGNAQRRGRRALLHHGTLLYAFEISSLDRYLKEPVRQPAYRGRRPHSSFVTNMPVESSDVLKVAVAKALGVTVALDACSDFVASHRSVL
jgi:lipoate---protein ligase